MAEDLISLAEAAEICGGSAAGLRRLCEQGKLNGARKIGRNWVLPRETAKQHVIRAKGWAGYWRNKKEEL